jgi:hypothetical protein
MAIKVSTINEPRTLDKILSLNCYEFLIFQHLKNLIKKPPQQKMYVHGPSFLTLTLFIDLISIFHRALKIFFLQSTHLTLESLNEIKHAFMTWSSLWNIGYIMVNKLRRDKRTFPEENFFVLVKEMTIIKILTYKNGSKKLFKGRLMAFVKYSIF